MTAAFFAPVRVWTIVPPEPPRPVPIEPVWIGSPNFSNGRASMPVTALVVHTMAGTLAGCDSWFQNPAAQVSSHYGVGLQGQAHQYVHLRDTAWANGILEPGNTWPGQPYNVNAQTVSIETEDNGSGSTPVTEEMYQSTLALARLALQTYPGIGWLLGHHCISPQSRTNCPGARWRDSGQFDRLARDLHLSPRY